MHEAEEAHEPTADAAAAASASSSPAGSSTGSPQSSFPGFQLTQHAPDATSPSQPGALTPTHAPSPSRAAAQNAEPAQAATQAAAQQVGVSTPDKAAAHGWGALFSPERSPSAAQVASGSPLGDPLEAESPVLLRQRPTPATPTAMPTPWDDLFSASPGGPASPKTAPSDSTMPLSQGAIESRRPVVNAKGDEDGLPSPLAADQRKPAPSDKQGGGFVALLEASLTELPGSEIVQDSPAVSSVQGLHAPHQSGTAASKPPALSAGVTPAMPASTAETETGCRSSCAQPQDSSDIDAPPHAPSPDVSIDMDEPDLPSERVPLNDGGHGAMHEQGTPEPSISRELGMVPAQAAFQTGLSPLDSEATFTLQPDKRNNPAPGWITPGTPSWGWGGTASGEASFETHPAASVQAVADVEQNLDVQSGRQDVVPASPAESVGSAAGPTERAMRQVMEVRSCRKLCIR